MLSGLRWKQCARGDRSRRRCGCEHLRGVGRGSFRSFRRRLARYQRRWDCGSSYRISECRPVRPYRCGNGAYRLRRRYLDGAALHGSLRGGRFRTRMLIGLERGGVFDFRLWRHHRRRDSGYPYRRAAGLARGQGVRGLWRRRPSFLHRSRYGVQSGYRQLRKWRMGGLFGIGRQGHQRRWHRGHPYRGSPCVSRRENLGR